MNNQEFIETLEEIKANIDRNTEISDYTDFSRGKKDAYNNVIGLAKQLDEPKKVVVPKFVAYFIEDGNNYDKIAFLAHQKYLGINSLMRECPVKDWLMSVDYETVLSLVNGYEVEKEQLYYVKLPEIGYMRFGKKYFYSTDKEDAKRYTENQIKAIDERYWPFAVKVDGE